MPIQEWMRKKNIERVVFNRRQTPPTEDEVAVAKVVLTAGLLTFNDAIHVDRLKLTKDDEIFDWMGKQGVDVAKFKEMYNSFTVSNQVRKATQIQDAYGVEGVPSMGVAGRYYTDGTMAGSMQNVLQVVDQLAAQARKGA